MKVIYFENYDLNFYLKMLAKLLVTNVYFLTQNIKNKLLKKLHNTM